MITGPRQGTTRLRTLAGSCAAESLEEKTAPGAGSVRVPRVCTAFLLLVVLTIANARAQTPKAQTLHPLAPSDTSSPRATFASFLAACDELYALVPALPGADADQVDFLPATERILDCLDLSELPRELRDSAGIESAVFLKEVLDRVDLPADEEIPGKEDSADTAFTWRVPGTRYESRVTKLDRIAGNFVSRRKPCDVPHRSTRRPDYCPIGTEGRAVSRQFHDRFVAATKTNRSRPSTLPVPEEP